MCRVPSPQAGANRGTPRQRGASDPVPMSGSRGSPSLLLAVGRMSCLALLMLAALGVQAQLDARSCVHQAAAAHAPVAHTEGHGAGVGTRTAQAAHGARVVGIDDLLHRWTAGLNAWIHDNSDTAGEDRPRRCCCPAPERALTPAPPINTNTVRHHCRCPDHCPRPLLRFAHGALLSGCGGGGAHRPYDCGACRHLHAAVSVPSDGGTSAVLARVANGVFALAPRVAAPGVSLFAHQGMSDVDTPCARTVPLPCTSTTGCAGTVDAAAPPVPTGLLLEVPRLSVYVH